MRESKLLLVSFCVLVVATRTIFFINSDSFQLGAQPNQLPQVDHSEGTRTPLFGLRIHNVANGGGSFSSTKGARVILFRQKLPE